MVFRVTPRILNVSALRERKIGGSHFRGDIVESTIPIRPPPTWRSTGQKPRFVGFWKQKGF